MSKKIPFGWIMTLIGMAEAERIKQLKDLGLKRIFTGSYKNEFSKGNAIKKKKCMKVRDSENKFK